MSRPFRAVRLRLVALLRQRRQQSDYDEELAFHQHMLREKLLREGTPAGEVDTATRRQFGNTSRWYERFTELRQFTGLENIMRDIAFAARLLIKSPGFTITAILTIALGIGANTAIFSLINGLMLRPLPVPNAQQLVLFGRSYDDPNLCEPLVRALERNHSAFTGVSAFSPIQLQVGVKRGGASVPGVLVSGQYFETLQTAPLLGRYLLPADDSKGMGTAGLAVVLSERYWRTALHGDSHIIGRKLVANTVPFTIVGVMPQRFIGADPAARPQIFIPLAAEPLVNAPYSYAAMGYHAWWLNTIGRVKPGISLAQANASLASATSDVLYGPNADPQWAPDERRSNFHFVAEPAPGGFTFVRRFFRQPLEAVAGFCCGLLLLACLNLTSLLFARSAAREHELATRVAIGATRRRLIQQLLIESLLLSIIGAAIGLALAPFVARALSTLLLSQFNNSYLDTSLDWRVLCVAACSTILATVLIGLAPALHATGRSLHLRLKSNQSSPPALSRRSLLPPILLSTQIALALALVVGSGLLATSLVRLYSNGFGFDVRNVNVVHLSMAKQSLEGDALVQSYHSMHDEIAALPGSRARASSTWFPSPERTPTTTSSAPVSPT